MQADEGTKKEVLKFTDVLRKEGIHTVSVSYSGCGDEGRTEDPQFEDAEGKPIDPANVRGAFDVGRIGDLLADFVPEGYQNDEGGWGTVTFDVEAGTIFVKHNWYETVSHAEPWLEI